MLWKFLYLLDINFEMTSILWTRADNVGRANLFYSNECFSTRFQSAKGTGRRAAFALISSQHDLSALN